MRKLTKQSGFYLGASAGYGSSHTCFEIPLPVRDRCIRARGGLAGGRIGYRWQSNWWVFGLEAQGTRHLTLSVPAIAPLAPYESIHQDVDLATVRVNYRWGAPVVAKY